MVKKNIQKKKFQIFIWNSRIHNAFMVLLLVTILILTSLTYVQNIYIDQLKLKNVDLRTDVFKFDYNVVPIEDFAQDRDLESTSITQLYKYFLDNDYENVYLNVGFVEGTITECGEGGCFEVTYRFNQRKGLYIDVVKYKIE